MLNGVLVLALAVHAVQTPPAPPDRGDWMPYAAELRIATPGKPETFGRLLQDEHGCNRREMVDADGVDVLLGESGKTTRLAENFTLTLTRIGSRRAPQ